MVYGRVPAMKSLLVFLDKDRTKMKENSTKVVLGEILS